MVKLNEKQIQKLSDILSDISKGMFIAGLLAPAVSSSIGFAEIARALLGGLLFGYLSIRLLGEGRK